MIYRSRSSGLSFVWRKTITLATERSNFIIAIELVSSANHPLMNVRPRLSTKPFITSASPLLWISSSKHSARASL